MHGLLLTLAVALVTGRGVAAPAPDSLEARVRARVAQTPGAEAGVAYWRLDGRPDSLFIEADTSFHAASTMKVPVMIELFRQVDAGGLSLDQPILLVNRFGSIVDGTPYALDAGDDSDSSMYRRVGQRVSVRELMDHMIERSSNLATNALIALVGADRTTQSMRALGASRIQVRRGVEDQKAYDRGLNNTTTARDLGIILAAIAQDRAASPRSCAAMRDILLRQQFNSMIPAGLPPGTPVAHKTGDITAHRHDAAIVYPPGGPPYVLVVLTRGVEDGAVLEQLVADLSRIVWEHARGGASAAAATSRGAR